MRFSRNIIRAVDKNNYYFWRFAKDSLIAYKNVDGVKTFNENNIKVKVVREPIDEEKNNMGSFTSSDTLISSLYKFSLSSIKSAFQ
jgi:hypothetical protein